MLVSLTSVSKGCPRCVFFLSHKETVGVVLMCPNCVTEVYQQMYQYHLMFTALLCFEITKWLEIRHSTMRCSLVFLFLQYYDRVPYNALHIDGLMQEIRNSSVFSNGVASFSQLPIGNKTFSDVNISSIFQPDHGCLHSLAPVHSK